MPLQDCFGGENMDVREKLVELLKEAPYNIFDNKLGGMLFDSCLGMIADHLITNGVTVQEWIPVGDPPKERGVYIVTVKHWLDGKPVTREAKWNGADWLSCYKAEEITPRVTHWQPMPQPPKGE